MKAELSLRITTKTQKFRTAESLITNVAGERDAVIRYVCLKQAEYYATLSGNTAVALKALGEIVSIYNVDALETRRTCLEKLKSTKDPRRAAQVAQAALQAMEESLDQDDYSKAKNFLEIATFTSRRHRDPNLDNRAKELRLRLKQRLSAAKTRS